MDKFVVKLKRHSSSYETCEGEQLRKAFIDQCQNSRPTYSDVLNSLHSVGGIL